MGGHAFSAAASVSRRQNRGTGFNFRFGKTRGHRRTPDGLCSVAGRRCVPVPPFASAMSLFQQPDPGRPVAGRRRAAGAAARAAVPYPRHRRAGQRRGQTLGFPTANLEGVETLVPGNGVYAVQVRHAGGVWAGRQ